MEIMIPEDELTGGGFEAFNDFYYAPNFTEEQIGIDPFGAEAFDEICKVTRPVDPTAQTLTSVVCAIGILLNCCVIYVIVVLKEYKKSRLHELILHIMTANVIFLFFVFLQMINELHQKWITSVAFCRINEASLFSGHSAGVVFLMTANVCGSLSQLKFICCWTPNTKWSTKEAVKSILMVIGIWLLCILINLPLYRYSNVNECGQCALEFPIDVDELCQMLGLDKSTCIDVMNIIVGEELNMTTPALNSSSDGYFDYSGELMKYGEYDEAIRSNLSDIASLASCRYEEPRAFYLWLYSSFVIFYVTPLLIFAFYVLLWYHDVRMRGKNRTKNSSNKQDPSGNIIVFLDLMFVFCWTPWNIVNMRKAKGGIGDDGFSCASVINYSRFFAITYNAVAPCIYMVLTPRFRNRLTTSLACNFDCCRRLVKGNSSETIVASQANGEKTASTDCEMGESNYDKTEKKSENQNDTMPVFDV